MSQTISMNETPLPPDCSTNPTADKIAVKTLSMFIINLGGKLYLNVC